MANIIFYSIDESFKTVEHGIVTKDQALEIIDKYSAMQVGLKGSAEEVVSKSLFGFSIDDRRFIEIAMETESRFRVKLEMPESKRLLFIPISSIYQKEIVVEGLNQLHDITTHLFSMNLDDFKTYFESQR
jgi:hypothetical protein